MYTVENKRILLVGAGNLATSLGVALKCAGCPPVGVWSRTAHSARILGTRLDCFFSDDISQLPSADIVIISVSDNALSQVAHNVAAYFPQALIVHTAGSVSMDILRRAGCKSYGVLYPMQTFSKARVVDFSTVGIFVEGCNETAQSVIVEVASSLGGKVYAATSEQRRYLHLAAVFACNFSNALYAMSAEILQRHGLPFDAMLPLIDETAAKVHRMSPHDAQTGPAQRGDTAVMDSQREALSGNLLSIYNLISEYIEKQKETNSDN